MVATLSLLQSFEVGLLGLYGGPRGAVNSLELLVVFVSPPVGSGDPGKCKTLTDHSAVWNVWPAAQVKPSG